MFASTGSILAVTLSDPYADGGESKFVGICIERSETGNRNHVWIVQPYNKEDRGWLTFVPSSIQSTKLTSASCDQKGCWKFGLFSWEMAFK